MSIGKFKYTISKKNPYFEIFRETLKEKLVLLQINKKRRKPISSPFSI